MPVKKRAATGTILDYSSVYPVKTLEDNRVQKLDLPTINETVNLNFLVDSCKDDPRPYLTVRIFGTFYKALLDSGASHTIMGRDLMWLFNKFPARLQPLTNQFIQTADMDKHQVIGKTILPLTLADKTKCLSVLVVPSLPQGLILGIDFWNSMHIVMDAYNRSWEFSSGVKTIGQSRPSAPQLEK